VPTYLQLVQQVEQALRLGYLAQGDQLPTVKDVVGGLASNPNTVLKAIAEQNALRTGLQAWLQSADEAGLDEDGIAALFTSALRDFPEHHAVGRRRGRARKPGIVA
jgi:GntR family transcriptional regulator